MGVVADNWLEGYRKDIDNYKLAAKIAADTLQEVFSGVPIAIHSITARAKIPASAGRKIRDKKYGRPQSQMNDVIGVRIITSYAQGVEEVVRRLKDRYEIDEVNSVDKREALGIGLAGYRSVHLVLTLGKIGRTDSAAKMLEKMKIEVQVRSIIEHAWAEIEHELRYKSGLSLSDEIKRRFTVIAGTLELVDKEFDNLSEGLAALVFSYRDRYAAGEALDDVFDSARLMGYLMANRPELVCSGPNGLPLPFERAAECLAVLAEVGILRPSDLGRVMDQEKFRAVIRDYADRRSIEPGSASALVLVMAALSLTDRAILKRSALLSDSVFDAILEDA